ncbi:PRPL13 [Auxenochlorella protothecoides x Auxenochlorella symbiontica]
MSMVATSPLVGTAAQRGVWAPQVAKHSGFFGARLPSHAARAPRASSGTASPLTTCVAATPSAPPQARDRWNITYYPKGADAAALQKQWYIIDAEGQTLGRLATLAATHIRGKNSPAYSPSMDMGGYVIVINAEKVAVTGRKETDKTYFRHAVGRPGSWTVETLRDLRKRIPERILEKAIRGMLPKGKLGNHLFRHLKVYKGASHPHVAQTPTDITRHINLRPSEVAALKE